MFCLSYFALNKHTNIQLKLTSQGILYYLYPDRPTLLANPGSGDGKGTIF